MRWPGRGTSSRYTDCTVTVLEKWYPGKLVSTPTPSLRQSRFPALTSSSLLIHTHAVIMHCELALSSLNSYSYSCSKTCTPSLSTTLIMKFGCEIMKRLCSSAMHLPITSFASSKLMFGRHSRSKMERIKLEAWP